MNELWNFDEGALGEVKAVCDVLFRHLKQRPLYHLQVPTNNQGQIPLFDLEEDTDMDLQNTLLDQNSSSIDVLYEFLRTSLHYLSTHSNEEYQIIYELIQSLASKLAHSHEAHKLLEQENKTLMKLIICNSNTATPNISPSLGPSKPSPAIAPVNSVNYSLQTIPIAINNSPRKPKKSSANNRSFNAVLLRPAQKTKPKIGASVTAAAEDLIQPKNLQRMNTSVLPNYWKSLNDVGKSASVSGYPSPKSISPTRLSTNFRSPKVELSFQH